MPVGCGKDSSYDTPSSITGSSRFEGSWNGTWNDAGLGQSGTLNIIVSSSGGNTNGNIHNTTLGKSGYVNGTVDSGGNVNLTYSYTGNTYTARGTVNINTYGHCVGSVEIYEHNIYLGTATLDLTKQ
jgi:hypothetical protein